MQVSVNLPRQNNGVLVNVDQALESARHRARKDMVLFQAIGPSRDPRRRSARGACHQSASRPYLAAVNRRNQANRRGNASADSDAVSV
jgi:hypothetical protein